MSLLLIIGIILGLSIVVGYKNGLVKITASLLTTVIIIILVSLLTPYVSQWIRKTTSLEKDMQEKVVSMLVPEEEAELDEKIEENQLSRNEQIAILEKAPLPQMFRQMLVENNNNEVYQLLGVQTFAEYVGSYLAKLVADIIAFLIVFVVVTVVVRIAMKMLGILNKLPVIGGVNRLAGALVGVGIGIVIVWILFIVVTLLYDTTFGKMCFETIESTPILRKLYDSNILMNSIIKF